MKHILPYIVVIVATLLLVWIIKPFNDGVDVQKYEIKIEKLELQIRVLRNKNSILKAEADTLSKRIEYQNSKINTLSQDIRRINYETKQKLDAVDLLHDYELERFFTDRYKQHNDSIN